MPKSVAHGLTSADVRLLLEVQRMTEEGESPGTVQLAKGIVRRTGWGTFELTAHGRMTAAKVVHNHRVIESYFVIVLGLDAEYACREASKIGHIAGDRVVASMCRSLNWPERCVHGREVSHSTCR
jgi:Mn-dependent DtxR family transcriptional regulator